MLMVYSIKYSVGTPHSSLIKKPSKNCFDGMSCDNKSGDRDLLFGSHTKSTNYHTSIYYFLAVFIKENATFAPLNFIT
jgi:hypothetical protein